MHTWLRPAGRGGGASSSSSGSGTGSALGGGADPIDALDDALYSGTYQPIESSHYPHRNSQHVQRQVAPQLQGSSPSATQGARVGYRTCPLGRVAEAGQFAAEVLSRSWRRPSIRPTRGQQREVTKFEGTHSSSGSEHRCCRRTPPHR